MSNHRTRRRRRPSTGGQSASPATSAFQPVPVQPRHDGWTPVRQDAFIRALAECAHVEEACAAVGMSARSAYTLRARPDAVSFRQAWDAALDCGVHRLADAMLGRALNGVATPVFYKGEQIGERRQYDTRLGMFILRTRAPERYGKWRDAMQANRAHPDGAARVLGHALRALNEDTQADAAGKPRPERAPLKMVRLLDDPAEQQAIEQEEEEAKAAYEEVKRRAFMRTLDVQTGAGIFDYAPTAPHPAGDVARRS